MACIEWNVKGWTGESEHRLVMDTYPDKRESSFDLYVRHSQEDDEDRVITNITVSAAKSVRDALDHFILMCEPSTPLIKEADPELERLLAEEDEIERDFKITARTVGALCRLLKPFVDETPLTPRITVHYLSDLKKGSTLRLEERMF